MNKQSQKNNTKPASNKNTFIFGSYPNLKKSKTDYGKLTIEALNRATREFYTAKELAEKLRVNIMTIYRYIKAKKLKAYKFGKEFRIDKKEFDSFLNKAKTNAKHKSAN
ncbi:MAG: helix-turn-helix domain-containing protein [Patescibacteria group bacterium]